VYINSRPQKTHLILIANDVSHYSNKHIKIHLLKLRLNYTRGPLSLRFVTDSSFKLFWKHISPLSLRFVTHWSFKLFWLHISPLSL